MQTDHYMAANGLSKRFGSTPAVDDATFAVQEGETLALLGPSGCGKTTLLRILTGLTRADAGSVTLGGELLTGPSVHVAPERRRVGMVFQDRALFPHLTVEKNVAYGLTADDAARGRANQALELVGLSELGNRHPEDLSGGQPGGGVKGKGP